MAARILRGNEPDVRGQLAGILEAREVAELGDDGDRDEPLHPAERLHGLHDWIQPPRRRAFEQLGLEAPQAINLFVHGANGFLKDDLLRRRRTHDLREVPPMGVVPIGTAHIVQAEA